MNEKKRGWLPDPLWQQVKASVPIACVDVIVANPHGAVLLGWRVIRPYVNVWALLGGRIRMGEDLEKAARRILSTHGLSANNFNLVGVFPIRFPSRFDVSICLAATGFSGNPAPDGTEIKKIGWFRNLPKATGKNYAKMIRKWRNLRRSPQALQFSQI
jgi:ADP-ribose pyrophosphatase YjhB (NUDIX family)